VASPVISYSKQKIRDITSLLGQMCPPAATSASFRELGPIVPSSTRWVIGSCELPTAAVGRTHLVVIDRATNLDGGQWFGEGAGHRQQQRWWCRWLRGEGTFSGFCRLAGKGALTAAVASVVVGHVGVVDRTVVPKIRVPLGQDTVGVVAIDVWSRTPMTPMAHAHAVEAEPFRRRVRTHHVVWTTLSDDNCRQAVDGT
jgi:hypothetical protein